MDRQGGSTISANERADFDALEERIRSLVKRHRAIREENHGLRRTLEQRDRIVRELEEQIRELNQRRQDAAKRLDELIGRVARLDERLGARVASGAEGKA